MTDAASESGELAVSEYVLIKNLLSLETLTVKDIMTPKSVIMMADESLTLRQLYDQHNGKLEFSRIPIYKENRDNITGILLKDDLLQITFSLDISNKTKSIVMQNIVFSVTVIVLLIISNLFQIISLPLGVIGHEGSTILVILNSLRLLRYRSK